MAGDDKRMTAPSRRDYTAASMERKGDIMSVVITDDEAASRQGRRALNQDLPARKPDGRGPVRATLEGRLCLAEPADAARHDIAALYPATHGDAERDALWDYLGYGPFASPEAMSDWFAGCVPSKDPLFFVLKEKAAGRLMGMATLMETRPAMSVTEIGNIWLSPDWQGTAETTEALYLLMHHALDDLGYRRLEWKCNAFNMPSRKAALRLGFRYEGIFWSHMVIKGRNRDTTWFSMLDSEWPAVKANFEAWLAPGNFDADGQQKTSLGEMNRALW